MADSCDVIELTVDVPDPRLRAGLRGTIVHCHGDGAYEVEFVNNDGETEALVVLRPEQFIVVWQAATGQWVPVAGQIAALVSKLPEESSLEVLNFARYQSARQKLAGPSVGDVIDRV